MVHKPCHEELLKACCHCFRYHGGLMHARPISRANAAPPPQKRREARHCSAVLQERRQVSGPIDHLSLQLPTQNDDDFLKQVTNFGRAVAESGKAARKGN
mmetsp:Transcript_89346/g.139862  ORF Transcript_89346/g.139862 Transcript_89346/m.139862 type:complete len:100 (-) Transcript_89346:224-523(-)